MKSKFQVGEVVQLRCTCIAKITEVASEKTMWMYESEIIEFRCSDERTQKYATNVEEYIFKMPLSNALKRVEVE